MTHPWSRAIRCVTRKPRRSLLMILIMTVVFTALVAQSGVRSTMAHVKHAINTNVGAGFTATGPSQNGAPSDGPTPGIDPSLADRLASLPEVAQHSLEASTLARPKDATPVAGTSGVQLDPKFAGDVSVTGANDSELNPAFQGKLYQLTEGTHAGSGTTQALIHREFASHNNLGPGDTFTLTRDGSSVTVTVAGIFDGKTENPTGLPSGASQNQVFVDLESAQKLGAPLTTGRYFTHNAQQLTSALDAAKRTAPDLTLEDNSAQFAPVLQAIAGVDRLLTILLLTLCVAGAGVLTLVSTFWARGRIHEVGILLSLGKSKGNVLAQFAIESSIFAAVATLIAAGAGTVLSNHLGRAVFTQVGGETLSSLQLTTSAGDVVAAVALGFVLVLMGVSVGVLPLITQRPKRILAKLS
ncbi:ABC transporter permease [Brevibacterium sp. ACRRH]|uniref:ABC transporter permease n=1 Tax=Brevibacterium sp. ACRRH TaxID=2918183 RepID=UPI001EF68E9C|nr:ABC transporter permease [Brevibacterium sp. ACRRH]MCG7299405.1 ABC transporter permease [Brevibacterium sp. ACRRH]